MELEHQQNQHNMEEMRISFIMLINPKLDMYYGIKKVDGQIVIELLKEKFYKLI